RVRDQPRATDPIAGQLGEAVDGFSQEPRRRMRVAVPALVELRIAQPEIRADVDDHAPLVEPGAGLPRGLAGRQGRENTLRVADVGADDEGIGGRVEMRLKLAQWLALARACDRRDESRLRVTQDESRELAAGVAGGAD